MAAELIQRIHKGLIVSCQAYPGDPMYGSDVMAKMAVAAEKGGAAGIRANGVDDIEAIRHVTDLPIIGIIKQQYSNSDIYITPTKKEVEKLLATDIDIIALDATPRTRPGNENLDELIMFIKGNSDKLVMADVSNIGEALAAEALGVDLVGPTLAGYTSYTEDIDEPDWALIQEMVKKLTVPVIAEGKISSPDDAGKALQLGCHSVVVGTAITRPEVITMKFVDKMKEGSHVKI